MEVRFIDLFAGIGGTRLGFEQACKASDLNAKCVFTSEIKPFAIDTYKQNFPGDGITGDITAVKEKDIPDFDFLLAGFPCQAFSSAGSRRGFVDTRGTLFFDIERILKAKKPKGFLLENVDGLVNHDKLDKSKPYGRTMEIILGRLEALGYKVTWKVLNASDFGVPQNRKRVYFAGSKTGVINLDSFEPADCCLANIMENGLPTLDTPFVQRLLSHYSIKDLQGKAVKDKRGGANNIHSWDIELKGKTTATQRELLSLLLKHRRQKKWAAGKGIVWMDGMPLTLKEVKTFYDHPSLQKMLDDLVRKGYLKFEHPKGIVKKRHAGGIVEQMRRYNEKAPKGYNIVAGKLSFEISKILHPQEVTPTLVATDVTRMVVPDGGGLRRLSVREGLRLSGFPDWYKMQGIKYEEAFDLLGNTVIVPVIQAVASRALNQLFTRKLLVA